MADDVQTVERRPGTPPPLGRIFRQDTRSLAFPAPRAPIKSVQWQIGSILDQGDRGACTGFASAAVLNMEPNASALRKAGIGPLGNDEGLAIYCLATVEDRIAGTWPPVDAGSSGLGAAAAMRKLSLITRYTHAFGLTHLLEALSQRPVMIGAPWLEAMFQPDKDGVVTVAGDVAGGHEWAAYGIDVARQLVLCQQSWGLGWGQQGRFAVPFTGMGQLLAMQGDVTVPIV